jgi:excisionase family DNA binding protein
VSIECPHCGGDVPHTCDLDDQIWEEDETAAHLRVSVKTLRRMIDNGRGPPCFLIGGRWKFRRGDVTKLDWCRERRRRLAA